MTISLLLSFLLFGEVFGVEISKDVVDCNVFYNAKGAAIKGNIEFPKKNEIHFFSQGGEGAACSLYSLLGAASQIDYYRSQLEKFLIHQDADYAYFKFNPIKSGDFFTDPIVCKKFEDEYKCLITDSQKTYRVKKVINTSSLIPSSHPWINLFTKALYQYINTFSSDSIENAENSLYAPIQIEKNIQGIREIEKIKKSKTKDLAEIERLTVKYDVIVKELIANWKRLIGSIKDENMKKIYNSGVKEECVPFEYTIDLVFSKPALYSRVTGGIKGFHIDRLNSEFVFYKDKEVIDKLSINDSIVHVKGYGAGHATALYYTNGKMYYWNNMSKSQSLINGKTEGLPNGRGYMTHIMILSQAFSSD